MVFGIWKDPGFLKTKLLAIDRHGEVLIRPNYEKKISCDFNMSKLQVAFILHNLTMKDENHYCLQVELGLHQPPLTDPVMLLLEGNIFVTFHLWTNATDPEAGVLGQICSEYVPLTTQSPLPIVFQWPIMDPILATFEKM